MVMVNSIKNRRFIIIEITKKFVTLRDYHHSGNQQDIMVTTPNTLSFLFRADNWNTAKVLKENETF